MIDFITEAQALSEYTRSLRKDFHRHPEIGFGETRTSGIVLRELTSMGLKPVAGVAGTGVVCLIAGKKPGSVLLVRADMDALPIQEETGAPYASEHPGLMHACGHDGHTAVLLAVARILSNHRDEFSGTVKLVFQPAEEGMGGAEKMIAEGVLRDPDADRAIGLHVWNEKHLGWFGISGGASMAGGEIFKVKVVGKGGHGAVPHLAVDPILAASQIVVALQSIVARNVPPLKSAVVSACTIHGGETFNVIPPAVEITGTIRTFDEEIRSAVLERFQQTTTSIATAMGCVAEVEIDRLTPAVVNHAPTAAVIQAVARELFPSAQIDDSNYVTMGSEDFAYILEKVPGCFFFIGSANEAQGLNASHHHPKFDFDETALIHGAALLTGAIVRLLQ
jgi:amidohydrolase